MTDLGVKGFRVQVTERRSGRSYDLRHSGLSYESGLPGGFKVCTFTCANQDCFGPDRNVDYLDDIVVFYGDDVAWEGQVEEIAPDGRVVEFTCLGYSVTLKGQPLGLLFVDRSFERWRDDVYVPQFGAAFDWPSGLISYQGPVLEGADGAVGEFKFSNETVDVGSTITDARRSIVYVPPFGTAPLFFSADFRGSTPSLIAGIQYSMVVKSVITNLDRNDPNANTYATAITPLVADTGGVNTNTMTGALISRGVVFSAVGGVEAAPWFLMMEARLGSFSPRTTISGYAPGGDAYARWFNQVILGELHPDTGATLQASEMMVDTMIRSLLVHRIQVPRVRSSGEAIAPGRYLVQQATFDEATPETIIQRLCDLVGWEWGVFDGRRLYAGPPETVTALGFRDQAVFDAPPWYLTLRAEDGHNIQVAESAAGVINQVQMKTTGKATGLRYETIYTNYNDGRCPLNQPGSTPLEIRSRVVDAPEGFGQDDIAVYAAALLARYAAPQITGEVVISQPTVARVDMGTTTPFLIGVSEIGGPDTLGGRPMEFQTTVDAPLIRPGYWCHFPDLDTTLDESAFTVESGRRPMGGLGMIRNVAVEAGDGGAVVTLTLDDGSTRFDTAVAQFIEGRV